MAVVWDGTLILCDRPECGTSEQLPAWLMEQSSGLSTDDWLTARAWRTIAGRHFCPEHW